ncbi:MAG: hypothetical protein J6R79_01325 [Bacteroidaceae bacterium]|nr:hypothetical protein [Bacteroidaceae bacterium]
MKKITACLFAALAITAQAQDIYNIESFSARDLNGTARFVGMGGAMSALGADLSVMSTNPAGTALYRRNDVATTLSLLAQPHAEKMQGIGRTRASFDQLGFVIATPLNFDNLEYVNFGINYHKARNFKNHIDVANHYTGGMSQSWQMMDLAYANGWLDLDNNNDRDLTTPFTNLGYDTYMIDPIYDEEGNITGYEPSDADNYSYKRVQWGGTHQWDFNLSMNFSDRFYAGLTATYYDLNKRSYTDYTEQIINPADQSLNDYYYTTDEHTDGEGYGASFGLIWRPFEDNAFRVGLAIHTPVNYTIDVSTDLYMDSPYASNGQDYTARGMNVTNYYEVETPWRFNISAGGTIANAMAYGVEYEYQDATSADVTYDDGFIKDHALGNELERTMKGVHNFKTGVEFRMIPQLAMRVGYNYVSSPFKRSAYLNHFLDSDNYYYATNTDYVNLSETHRVTWGLGFTYKKFTADCAYMYQMQHADVYAFHLPEAHASANRLDASRVDLNQHKFMLTIGYKF